MQGLWSLRGGLPAESPAIGGPAEPLWLPPGRVSGQWLYRLRHLFLRLSGAWRYCRAAQCGRARCRPGRSRRIALEENVVLKQLTKGNEAIVKAAVLAGCR